MPLAGCKSIEGSKKNSLALVTQHIPSQTVTNLMIKEPVNTKSFSRKSSATSRNVDKRFHKVYESNNLDTSMVSSYRDITFNQTLPLSQSCVSLANGGTNKPCKKSTEGNKENKGTSKEKKTAVVAGGLTINEIKLQQQVHALSKELTEVNLQYQSALL